MKPLPVLAYAPRRMTKSAVVSLIIVGLLLIALAGAAGWGIHVAREHGRQVELKTYRERVDVLKAKKKLTTDEVAEGEELMRRIGKLKADGVK